MVAVAVAVVGAGPAGLTSAKSALEYGLTPTVFERAARPGGLWRGDGGFVRPALTTNISRFTFTFSDYSWPGGAPDFPAAAAVADYIAGYARAFDLERHVRFGCEVVGLEPVDSGWRVSWEHSGRRFNRWFDAAVVAAGFFAEPVVPPLTGTFGGLALHSGGYRDAAQLSGRRRAVVVGTAFSGSEIAAELAEAGVEVTAVTPRPFWLVPRLVTPPGTTRPIPFDLATRTRAARAGLHGLVLGERNRRRNRFLAALGADPARIHSDPQTWASGDAEKPPSRRLRPPNAFLLDPDSTEPPHVVVSDGLASALRSGRVALVRERVARLEQSAVVLGDGRRIGADALVWCTGFRPRLPFLPGSVHRVAEYDPADLLAPLLLGDAVFPAGVGRLFFVGMYRGPYLGTVELQARWAAAVIAGALPPPGAADVAQAVTEARRVRRLRPRPQFPYDDIALADRIGAALGVLPPTTAAATAIPVAEAPAGTGDWFWDSPVVPAHYRMAGPHSAPAVAARQVEEAIARCRGGASREEETGRCPTR